MRADLPDPSLADRCVEKLKRSKSAWVAVMAMSPKTPKKTMSDMPSRACGLAQVMDGRL